MVNAKKKTRPYGGMLHDRIVDVDAVGRTKTISCHVPCQHGKSVCGPYFILFKATAVVAVVPNSFVHPHRVHHLYSPHTSCLLGECADLSD